MEWHRTLTKDGAVIDEQEGIMADPPGLDAFAYMATQEGEKARVSVTVSRALQYGELKVSFTLAVSCPQTKASMDYASRAIFSQAVIYVNNGMQFLVPELPPLNVPQAP